MKISRITANVFPGAVDPHLEMWPIILRLHMQGENLHSAKPQPFQIFISIIILKEHPLHATLLSDTLPLCHLMHLNAVKPEPNEVCECVCVNVSYLGGGGGGTRLIDSAVNKLQKSPNAPAHTQTWKMMMG